MRRTAVIALIIGMSGAVGLASKAAATPSPRATVWAARYDAAKLLDRAADVVASPDGTTVFVTGTSTPAFANRDMATIAYDAATGAQVWLADYDGPGDSYDGGESIAVAPDGSRVYVTGFGNPGFTTLGYDASTGTQLWVARYAGGTPEHLLVSPDGTKVFVTGDDQTRWHVIAYDAATGAQLWIVQFVPGLSSNEHAAALSADGSRIFVTGDYYTGNNQDYATVAYDTATGGFLWSAVWDDGLHHDDHTRAVAVSPDGSQVFVSGMAAPFRTVFNTIAYDAATGAQEWVATYDNNGAGGHHVEAIGVSLDGAQVVVTGPSWGHNSMDYATVAYDTATGTQVWVARYIGPIKRGRDASDDLGIDPAGALVYVTGKSEGNGTGFDYATVAYDVATGTQVWAERYEGPADDEAAALAVGTGGDVFVTGTSMGADAKSDYLTTGRLG
jgi:DNA-binding beta-propeller fold protein YncE